MESTLLHSFLKASKLKRWLTQADCPQIFQEIKELFDQIYAPKTRDSDENTVDDSEVHPQTHSVPSDLKSIVNAKGDKISLQARLWQNGIMYSVESTHTGNSQIYFYPNGDLCAPPVAGSIQYIYNIRKPAHGLSELVQAPQKSKMTRAQARSWAPQVKVFIVKTEWRQDGKLSQVPRCPSSACGTSTTN